MSRRIDLSGQRFGSLVAGAIVGYREWKNGKYTKRQPIYACKCDCGEEHAALGDYLRTGQVRSCGCKHWPKGQNSPAWKHGEGKPVGSGREYNAWKGMRARCYNPRAANFKNYGGRGITVCKRWRESFEAFLADMGRCPVGYSIDRINNDGNYQPGNCRWATRAEQSSNKRPRRAKP